MEVRVALSYDLAGPYHLTHEGTQGDNMDVGDLTKVSEKRTEVLRDVVRHSMRPEDMRPGKPLPGAYVPQQPTWPNSVLPEVGFGNDCCHFALSGWGLTLLMHACTMAYGAAWPKTTPTTTSNVGRTPGRALQAAPGQGLLAPPREAPVSE